MRGASLVFLALCVATPAAADPYRLRGDVFAATTPPAGLIMLQADGQRGSWLDAQAMVWAGADENVGDVLVIAVHARDPENRGDVRVGRFLVATGAIRPVHLDGIDATARAPWGTSVQAFAGVPVLPRFAGRDFDWLVGTRAAQTYRERGVVGLSYLHRRDAGRLADEEIGVDFAAVPHERIDVAARLAYDLVYPGISDAHLSAALRRRGWRVDLYGRQRSPSRMLPATSLFSALGDVPSREIGAVVLWRAAPRLDVSGSLAGSAVDGHVREDASVRATLRLDDRGAGAVAVEARRRGGIDAGWTGLRVTGRYPFNRTLASSAEIELVIPDDSRGRGALWPWALLAVTWQPRDRWEGAVAVEASASPEHALSVSGLLRLTRRWGGP
jgi:hypothetical protein